MFLLHRYVDGFIAVHSVDRQSFPYIDRYRFRQIQVHIGLLYDNVTQMQRRRMAFPERRDPYLCLLQEEGFTAMSSSSRGIQCRLPMHNAVLSRLSVCLPIEDVFMTCMSLIFKSVYLYGGVSVS